MSDMQTIKETDDFSIVVEDREGYLFVHVQVDNFNKSIMRDMTSIMHDVSTEAWILGWDRIFAYTPNPKFCRKICDCLEVGDFNFKGDNFKVMVWELKPQL